ncbi:GntR family transcriptional regulator [Ancylobacter sp. MQZ15Z-1]|uniref:GntR family transcriptional regulator n=2 Tax=Ancylobacter mangrovi TaxID=2972472 RepID=A0A9X2PFW2_9HYPH|nr:GntR family transcriptional regulator [Ancylobacter mangrovi]MCS0497170.1 GntR family transcriptional regulator [Ancylobacter mangrovi]
MPSPTFIPKPLVDQAFEWLEEAIIKGTYAPGTKLDEVALARAFNISRGPVREAIRRLEGKQLVERVPNIGARVASFAPDAIFDLLEVREGLEGIAARLATQRMSKEAIAGLDALLDRHAEQGEVQAGESYFQRSGDHDFHFRIIQGSGNAKLISMLCDDLYSLLRVYRYRSGLRPGQAPKSLQEHRSVVEAMKAGDADRAEHLMREHLRQARARLREEFEEDARKSA